MYEMREGRRGKKKQMVVAIVDHHQQSSLVLYNTMTVCDDGHSSEKGQGNKLEGWGWGWSPLGPLTPLWAPPPPLRQCGHHQRRKVDVALFDVLHRRERERERNISTSGRSSRTLLRRMPWK